jgi:hypothetical protein
MLRKNTKSSAEISLKEEEEKDGSAKPLVEKNESRTVAVMRKVMMLNIKTRNKKETGTYYPPYIMII